MWQSLPVLSYMQCMRTMWEWENMEHFCAVSVSKYCMSHTNPWLNDGTSSVTILHGWREIEWVGALFPKFAPQDKDCLIFIHPPVAQWWGSLGKSIHYDNEQIVIHLALSPLDSDSYQRERLRQKPSCVCVCMRAREGEREKEHALAHTHVCLRVCACVCVF